METKTKAIEKPSLLLVIIGSLLFGIIGSAWTLLQPTYTLGIMYNLSLAACALVLSVLPFNAIMLASLLGKFGPFKNKVNMRTLTYLYAFTIAAMFFNNEAAPHLQIMGVMGDRYMNPTTSFNYLPLFLAPSLDAAQKFRVGGYAVPWAEYTPMIIWWWLVTTLPALFAISLSVVFRKVWTDIEKVPFPQTMVAHELMKQMNSGGEKRSRSKPFVIGIIIGLAVQTIIFMADTFPWFPDVFGWRTNTCRFGATYITANSPLAGIAGLTAFGKWPAHAAIGYLAPLNILLSFLICYLVLIIIGTQVAYSFGYYTGITSAGGCGRVWCSPPIGLSESDPFKWNATGQFGLVGFTIFLLWGNRRHIADTIRAALKRLPTERMNEMEKDEPMSYRSAYLMMIVSFVLFIVFWMASGFSLLGAILMPLTLVLVFWGTTRIYGLVGFAPSAGMRWSIFLYRGIMYPTIPEQRTAEFATSMWISSEFGSDYPELGWGGSLFASFGAFRMASLTGTSNRDVLKIVTIATIIIPLTSIIGCIWVINTFGIGRTSLGYSSVWSSYISQIETGNVPTAPPWIPYALLGIVIVGILWFLHARFMWFPIEPAGYVLATTLHPLIEGLWLTFLIAYIAKTITLRVGGSKVYEEVGVPIAAGFLAGTTLILLIGGGVGVYKFFYPF